MRKTQQILRAAAVTVLGLGLGAGVASAAPGGSIENTGPDSWNKISLRSDRDIDVNNDNDISVRNSNPQMARTGDATVRHNTTGGSAESGAAMNDSLLRARLTLDNSGSTEALSGLGGGSSNSGSIDTTGPDSRNEITFSNDLDVDINNDNNVNVTNYNHQYATSGSARVSDNTTGGDATSGDASNVSTADVTVEVRN
jgi:hypothetical protein